MGLAISVEMTVDSVRLRCESEGVEEVTQKQSNETAGLLGASSSARGAASAAGVAAAGASVALGAAATSVEVSGAGGAASGCSEVASTILSSVVDVEGSALGRVGVRRTRFEAIATRRGVRLVQLVDQCGM